MATPTSLILTDIDRLSGGLHLKTKFNGIIGARQSLIYGQTWTRRWFKMTLITTAQPIDRQKIYKICILCTLLYP